MFSPGNMSFHWKGYINLANSSDFPRCTLHWWVHKGGHKPATPFHTMQIAFPSGVYFTTQKQIVNTLFNPGGTASGYYQKMQNGILFRRPNGTPWFFLCANGSDPFYVTCTVDSKKRIVYMLAMSSVDESALGLQSYSDRTSHAQDTWQAFE